MPTCSIPGCDRRRVGRGFCSGHYERWRKTGKPCADVPFGFQNGHRGPCEQTLAERFWLKVRKTESCWIWIGGRTATPKGKPSYGILWDGRRMASANRISWELNRGSIPEGMKVLHNCPGGDNPACVNPNHLWLGTQTENILDCEKKGRGKHLTGRRHGQAVLNYSDAKAILALRGKKKTIEIAVMFNVSDTTILNVFNGEHWTVREMRTQE